MIKRVVLIATAVAIGSGAAVTAEVRKLNFSPSDPQALVLVEERDGMRGGTLTFVAVDIQAMKRGSGKIEVGKTTRGQLRTSDPGLQTKGEGLLIPKNMSRFSAVKGAAGHYALVSFDDYNGVGSVSGCPLQGAPVFCFEPGKVNLVAAESLPPGGGSSNILAYALSRNGSNTDVADAQKILNEHATLRGEVVPAQVVSFVKFQDGKGRVSACSGGQTLVLVSETAG